MKILFVFFAISTLSINALAENNTKSFLCIAEHGSAVTKDAKGKLSSYSGVADNKYIVNKSNGLRHFGIDANWLNECEFDDSGRPTWCEYPGESWGGVFMMDQDNTFVINSVNPTPDMKGTNYYTVIGKCSAL